MKKSSSLVIYCTLILCTIIFFSLNSCSKENELTKTEPISLSAEKNQYAPYEIVTIAAPENLFTVQSFTAKINNVEVIIGSNENIGSFVLPNLANGNYDLSFTLNEKNYIVPITVVSLSNILSADQYFNEIKSGINQNINDLNLQITKLQQNSPNPSEYANLQNDVIKYTNVLNDYTTSYNNLSANDKQEFAKSIAANKALSDEYNQLISTLNTNTFSLRTAQSVQDYEAKVEAASLTFYSCVDEIALQIPKIVVCAIVAKTPIHPIINAGAILATGILVARFMINVDKTITAAITLTDKSLKPFEFITQTSQTVLYNNGVETLADIQLKYRSLIDSDGTNSNNGRTINAIVEKYNYFKDKYNNFIIELPSIFRPSYILTSLKNNFNSTTRSLYNKYVSISESRNPNVVLQQFNQPDGSIKIKATTTGFSEQNFAYDINYTNSNFTTNLKKTVFAKISQTCAIDPSLRTWTAKFYNSCYPNPDGTPSDAGTQTLTLNDNGILTIKNFDGSISRGTYNFNANCTFDYFIGGLGRVTVYDGSRTTFNCLSVIFLKQ